MRKLDWYEYCKENQNNSEKLTALIKKIYKRPNNPVSDNIVHMVQKELESKGKFEINNIIILRKKEQVEVSYNCDSTEELETMKKDNDIKSIDDLKIVFVDYIYTHDTIYNNVLSEVLTSNEAAKVYNISESSLRSAMKSGKLRFGIDYRKSGRITFITKSALKREYSKKEELNNAKF